MASPLSAGIRAFRVADKRHLVFDGTGAMLYGARWNSPGRRVIYCAETYSGCLLEVLVHASGGIPPNQGYIEIPIPAGVSVERVRAADLPGWDTDSYDTAQRFGDRWYDERRSAVLIVPSVVTVVEGNILINQAHPEFSLIQAGEVQPVKWDRRLWAARQPMAI